MQEDALMAKKKRLNKFGKKRFVKMADKNESKGGSPMKKDEYHHKELRLTGKRPTAYFAGDHQKRRASLISSQRSEKSGCSFDDKENRAPVGQFGKQNSNKKQKCSSPSSIIDKQFAQKGVISAFDMQKNQVAYSTPDKRQIQPAQYAKDKDMASPAPFQQPNNGDGTFYINSITNNIILDKQKQHSLERKDFQKGQPEKQDLESKCHCSLKHTLKNGANPSQHSHPSSFPFPPFNPMAFFPYPPPFMMAGHNGNSFGFPPMGFNPYMQMFMPPQFCTCQHCKNFSEKKDSTHSL